MPGTLTHSPADILRWCLIDLGHGTAPSDGLAWPVSVGGELATPDNAVTIYDTQGVGHGRTNPDRERQEHHGVQVRVRGINQLVGYQKARQIAIALDGEIELTPVVRDSSDFTIHAVTRTTDVIALGREPEGKRWIFTINAIASIREG